MDGCPSPVPQMIFLLRSAHTVSSFPKFLLFFQLLLFIFCFFLLTFVLWKMYIPAQFKEVCFNCVGKQHKLKISGFNPGDIVDLDGKRTLFCPVIGWHCLLCCSVIGLFDPCAPVALRPRPCSCLWPGRGRSYPGCSAV